MFDMFLLTTYLEFASCTTLASVTSKMRFSITQRVRRFLQPSCSCRVSMLEPFRVGPVGLISEKTNRNEMEMGNTRRTVSSQNSFFFFFCKNKKWKQTAVWCIWPSIPKFINGFSCMLTAQQSSFLHISAKKKQLVKFIEAIINSFNFPHNSPTHRLTPNHNLQEIFPPLQHATSSYSPKLNPNIPVRTTQFDEYFLTNILNYVLVRTQ